MEPPEEQIYRERTSATTGVDDRLAEHVDSPEATWPPMAASYQQSRPVVALVIRRPHHPHPLGIASCGGGASSSRQVPPIQEGHMCEVDSTAIVAFQSVPQTLDNGRMRDRRAAS